MSGGHWDGLGVKEEKGGVGVSDVNSWVGRGTVYTEGTSREKNRCAGGDD